MYYARLQRFFFSAHLLFGAADFDIHAVIESVRKDNIITFTSHVKPSEKKYYITEHGDVIGTIEILSVMPLLRENGLYRVTARYTVDGEEHTPLIRAGSEIALYKRAEKIPHVLPKTVVKEKIEYKKNIVSLVDNRKMVLVTEGKSLFGSDTGELDEAPLQYVELDAYYIDVYEVSQADYYMFIKRTNSAAPVSWAGKGFNAEYADYPVLVTYHEALAYAAWANKKLPTEEQWEKAARGKSLYVAKEQNESFRVTKK